jgi:nucleoside phosphorylase
VEPDLNAPWLLFALRREAAPFLRARRPRRPLCGAPCPAWWCGPLTQPVLVLETGVGTGCTDDALGWLSRALRRPRFVLSVGFSGALQDTYRVGDIILATEVVDTAGNRWPTTWAGQAHPALHRGRLLTVSQLVSDPEEKRALGRRHDAAVVDMEAAAVARWCLDNAVSFGAVRAVSDDLNTALSPRLVAPLAGSRVSALRLTAALLRSPPLVGELWRLARHTGRAARRLAAAIGDLLGAGSAPADKPRPP